MLTLTSILAVIHQNSAFGETGSHYFGQSSRPRTPEVNRDNSEPEPGTRVRIWDETTGNYIYTEAKGPP